jgi:hypothetical protein
MRVCVCVFIDDSGVLKWREKRREHKAERNFLFFARERETKKQRRTDEIIVTTTTTHTRVIKCLGMDERARAYKTHLRAMSFC